MQLGRKPKYYHKGNMQNLGVDVERKRFILGLNDMKNHWGIKDIGQAFSHMMKTKSKNFDLIKESLFPESYEKLNQGIMLQYLPDNLERELCWNAIIFNCCFDKINLYLKLKDNYENLLINGEYKKAECILNEIDNNLGVSIWGLDNRFILSEYNGGLESNKEYLAKINSLNCESWISLLTDFFSFKAEQGVNNRQYIHRIEKILDNASKDIKPFFEEKMYALYEIKLNEIYNMLYYNSGASIIDMYNTYIKACVRIAADDVNDTMKEAVKKSISFLNNIEDIVVDKLKMFDNLFEKIDFKYFDSQMIIIGDLYTIGKYDDVINMTQRLLDEKANCFELYEYYVKAHVMSGKIIKDINNLNIRNELIDALYVAYVKNEKTPKSYLSITKYVRLFSNSYLGTELANFFVDKYMIGISDILFRAKEYLSPYYNIKLINAMPNKIEKIIQIYEKEYHSNSVLNLIKYIHLTGENYETNNVETNRLRWYKIKKDIKSQKENTYQKLKEWYSELKEENESFHTYQKERISTELYYLYIENNMFLEAEELLVNNNINNKFSTLRLDLDALFNMSKIYNKDIKASICTPIATYLFDKNDYAGIYSTTANFLDFNKLSKPSNIFDIKDNYDKKQLIFFLRYVCTNEILDSMYNVFEVDDDVECERIEICQFLQKYDNANENVYIDEISQIMQKRRILQGIKYLEDVKIDLDINKVVDEQLDVFNDNYKRFRHIGELDIEYKVLDLTSNLIYNKYNVDSKKYNYKLIVFKEMLIDYRQELAFGKYGLDQTLGTRIRHGSLQNQIRIAFERNNIAFVRKNTEEALYLTSKEFDYYCRDLDHDSKEQLIFYISDFSKSIDEYVENLKVEYIRIKTEDENNKGLIDFSVRYDELVYLFGEAQKLQNENLVLELFENYWIKKVDDGLRNARNFFGNQVKQHFIDMLNELEEKLHTIKIIDKMQCNLFDSISRTRTEVQNAIDVIIDWFKLPTKQEFSSFDATSLVETCEMINKRVFTNYELIQVDKNIQIGNKMHGRTFSYLIDILVILFTNAYYHSGYVNDIHNLKIFLSITEVNENIVITMKNNLSKLTNRKELTDTIQELKVKLDECIKKREYYNYEGKSGYIKICKILDYNISCRLYLEFGMDEEEECFYSTIQILKRNIVEKEVNIY